MLIDGEKHACEACIRGHRVSNCEHRDRPLTKIAKKGRPVSQCSHCRALRKSRSTHTACECGSKPHTKAQCVNGARAVDSSTCCCAHGSRCTCALKKEPLDSVTESPYDGAIAPYNQVRPAETGIQPMINSLNSLNSIGSPSSYHVSQHQSRNPSAHPVMNPPGTYYNSRSTTRRPSSRPRSRDHTPLRTSHGRSRALSDGKAPTRESRWSGSSAQSSLNKSPSHASITARHLAPLDFSSFTPPVPSYTSGGANHHHITSQPNPMLPPRLSVDPISASTMSSDNFNFLSSPDNDSAVNSAVDIQSNWSFPDVLSSASSVSNMGSVPGSGIFNYQKQWNIPQYTQPSDPSSSYEDPALSQMPNHMPDQQQHYMFPQRPFSSLPPSHHSWAADSARSSMSYAQTTYLTIHSDMDLNQLHRGSSYSLPTYPEEYPHSMPSLLPVKHDMHIPPPEPPIPMGDDQFDLPIQMPMDETWAPPPPLQTDVMNGHAHMQGLDGGHEQMMGHAHMQDGLILQR